MAEPARTDVRYTAFLSYSHKDAAAAGRLHRRLESYRVPRRLVGTQTPRGPVPQRLWPIFRDRDELPAATDLSETVCTALAQSGALIILCSPEAAGSLWVAEEIGTFRKLHPDRPILAAVLDGDPPDCFPAALRAFGQDGTWHEPLATDLRPKADGKHLGLLKLVAGITGIGLDDLVQRDAARRIRRVMMVTGAALVAMLVMAALAVVAVQARREAERERIEAERQRSDAEGLVEFMLTDLRNRMRGSVGQLDIMQAVNAKALDYYGGRRELGGLSAESLLRRARILHAIGEDDLTQGRYPAALTAFNEAHRITAEQLARSPDDPVRQLEHARSEYWIGRVYELRRDWAPARRQYEHFSDATERLLAREPDNPAYLTEAAWSALDLGNLHLLGTGDYAAAQRAYEKAVRRFERANQLRPSDLDGPRVLANAYAWLADSFYMREMWRQSLAARERQYQIAERLHRAQPDHADYAYRLATAQRGITRSLDKVGDRVRARRELFRAFEWSRRLTARDPGNAEWQLLRALVDCDLVFLALGEPPGQDQAQLRRDFHLVADALAAEHNPRVSEISRCVTAMSPAARVKSARGDRR